MSDGAEVRSLLDQIDAIKKDNASLEHELLKNAPKEEGSEEGSYFSMGLDTHRVPMRMHANNRARLIEAMRGASHTRGVVLMQGGDQQSQYDTDTELVFRQESYFNYLFGVKEPGWYGVVDLKDGTATLFMPRLPEVYSVWQGAIQPPAHYQKVYATDAVCYVDELHAWLCKRMGTAADATTCLNSEPIFVLHGRNSDSGSLTVTTANYEQFSSFKIVDKAALHPVMANTRVIKSDLELDLMQYVNFLLLCSHACSCTCVCSHVDCAVCITVVCVVRWLLLL
jgi:Xaa-Pro dipeptidase